MTMFPPCSIHLHRSCSQSPQEHEKTKAAAENFLKNEGPWLQEKLKEYAADKMSYIEEFW